MIANTGTLKREQDSIVTDLLAQPLFATVNVLAADDADLERLIETSLSSFLAADGKKPGASVIVWFPVVTITDKEVARAYNGATLRPWMQIRFIVTCFEYLLDNRSDLGTGIPALTLAEAAAAALHRPVSAANQIARYVESINPVGPQQRGPDATPDFSFVGYYLEVITEGWATALQTNPTNPGP